LGRQQIVVSYCAASPLPAHRQSRHLPCQLRIEPHDPIGADGEIRRIEDGPPDEIQNGSINLWALWFHEVEHKFRRSIPALVHDADCRIIAVGNGFDPHLAFEDGVRVVEDRIDGMRGVTITCANSIG